MNRQEIYNRVKEHMLKQMKRCTLIPFSDHRDSPMCAYRNDQGHRCAVGCLMSDEVIKILGDATGGVNQLANHARYYREGEDNLELTVASYTFFKDIGVNIMAGTPGYEEEKYPHGDTKFLTGLQNIHDNAPTFQWKDRLEAYALDYQLKI